MNKIKALLMASVGAVIITAGGILYRINHRPSCQCVKFTEYQEVTLHPDGTFESHLDSACTVYGYKNGDIVLKSYTAD